MPDTTTCAPIRASPICCAALDWEVDRPQPPSRLVAQHVVGRDEIKAAIRERQISGRGDLVHIGRSGLLGCGYELLDRINRRHSVAALLQNARDPPLTTSDVESVASALPDEGKQRCSVCLIQLGR